jgi:pimeloyl-ACP methyl ester carboxylesterase
VRVIEVPQPGGSVWVVEVSGTQDWGLRAGGSPFDLTTDVRSMAQASTVLADGVQQALARAQADSAGPSPSSSAARGDAVMLVGHSLGGIAAAGLAASPRFTAEHRVTHVVTLGAPVARMPVPTSTQVLSLEHTRDPVPRLDGERNPDRATWVTVTRDVHDHGAEGAEAAARASRAHDLDAYVETAGLVDDSTDPSVESWRATTAPFFDGATHGEPVIRDYLVRRVRP